MFAALLSALHAIAKPFWYDEVCTVFMTQLPGASAIWKALNHGAEPNPPAFYLLYRCAGHLVSDVHLGYRLPSILGMLIGFTCMYLFLGRGLRPLSALIGATFLLCTPLAAYSYDARPYALTIGCIALAMLAWQRIDDSRWYCLLLPVALAAAVSFHYYAILIWPAFGAAELTVWLVRRRLRIAVWAGYLAGLLPFAVFGGLLLNFRKHYGHNFWSHPSLMQLFVAHNWLFNLGGSSPGAGGAITGYWGWIFAAGMTVALFSLRSSQTPEAGFERRPPREPLPAGEMALALMLLWLPALAILVAAIGHGGMTPYYMMPTILGAAVAIAYLIDRAPSVLRLASLLLLLVSFSISSYGVVKRAVTGNLLEERAEKLHEVQDLVDRSHRPDLPILLGSYPRLAPMSYYAPPGMRGRLYAVVDPASAAAFSERHADTDDVAALLQQGYFPLQVEDYRSFVSTHREFLLIAYSDPFEWVPARLLHDGYALTLLSSGEAAIYKVVVPDGPHVSQADQ